MQAPVSTAATEAATADQRVTFGAWWMVMVLLLFGIVSMVDRYIISMLVVPIQKDLHLSDFQIGVAMGPVVAICSALALLPFGWAADRFSRRKLIFGGVILWSVACMGSGLARSFGMLMVTRGASAMGEAALSPVSAPMIADRFPRRLLTTALAVVGLAPKLGMASAFAAAAAALAFSARIGTLHLPLIGDLGSWRLTLVLVGAPGLLLGLLAFSFAEPARSHRPAAQTSGELGLGTFLRANWRMLALLLTGYCLMGVCSGAIQNWAPTFVTRQYGQSAVQYGPIMSLISLIGALAIVPKGMIVDFLYARGMHDAHIRFFTWLQALGVPLLIIAFLQTNAHVFFILYGVLNILTLSIMLYVTAAVQFIAPQHLRGRVTAGMMFLVSLSIQALAPPLVAAVTDFVFHDEAKLGLSLIWVGGGALVASLVMLRISLRRLRTYLRDFRPDAPGEAAPEIIDLAATGSA